MHVVTGGDEHGRRIGIRQDVLVLRGRVGEIEFLGHMGSAQAGGGRDAGQLDAVDFFQPGQKDGLGEVAGADEPDPAAAGAP